MYKKQYAVRPAITYDNLIKKSKSSVDEQFLNKSRCYFYDNQLLIQKQHIESDWQY